MEITILKTSEPQTYFKKCSFIGLYNEFSNTVNNQLQFYVFCKDCIILKRHRKSLGILFNLLISRRESHRIEILHEIKSSAFIKFANRFSEKKTQFTWIT